MILAKNLNRTILIFTITFVLSSEEQESLCITLDAAQAAFFTCDKLVVSLKTGELYVLSLLADSMRSVRGFHFEKAAASVLTTCVSCLSSFFEPFEVANRLLCSCLLNFLVLVSPLKYQKFPHLTRTIMELLTSPHFSKTFVYTKDVL